MNSGIGYGRWGVRAIVFIMAVWWMVGWGAMPAGSVWAAESQASHSGKDRPILRIDSQGHMADIQRVIFTRDGKYLISAGDDKTIRIWDVETGRSVKTIRGQIDQCNEGMIYAAALSPDERFLAAGGWLGPTTGFKPKDAGRIRIHDFRTGKVLTVLSGHNDVVDFLQFSPDGKWLASSSHDRTVRLWSVDESGMFNEKAVLKGHRAHVYGLSFSPDSSLLVSGGDDHELRVWQTKDGSLKHELKGHTDKVRAVAFSPDGKFIVSGSWDRSIKVWDSQTGAFVRDLAVQQTIPNSLSFSADGTKIVTGTYKEPNFCHAYDFESGMPLVSFRAHDNNVWATAVSPDGRLAATGGGNNYPIYLWSLESGQIVKVLAGKGAPVWSVGVSRDGWSLAWGNVGKEGPPIRRGPLQKSLVIRQAGEKGEEEYGVWLGKNKVVDEDYIKARTSHDGRTLRARQGGDYGVEAVLEIVEGEKVVQKIERSDTDGYAHLAYTFNSKGNIVISGGYNGALIAYDAQTGKKLARFTGHLAEVYAVAVGPDDRLLVSGSKDQTVRLWDLSGLESGKDIQPLMSVFVGTDREWVAWSPRGYYTCSLKGDRYIGWHVNHGVDKLAEFFPAERFMAKFYRPDVMAAILELKSVDRAIEKVSQNRKTDSRVDVARLLPPEVSFLNPTTTDLKTDQDVMKVVAMAQSNVREPITEFYLLHNGRPIRFEKIEGTARRQSLSLRLEEEINLEPGLNEITLVAANQYARSNPKTIQIMYSGSKKTAEKAKPDLYVLAVGISQFEDETLSLNFAHHDAKSTADVLKTQNQALYDRVKVRVLTDEEATQKNILDGLDWLLTEPKAKDITTIFLAGHGLNDKLGRYYFVAHDTDITRLRSSAVQWSHFKEVLVGIPSRAVLLVDTCHGGNITGSHVPVSLKASDVTGALKEVVASGSQVVVFSATTNDGMAQERFEWGHGAFTKALIEGLSGGADYNKDHQVDIFEMNLFVTHKVTSLTEGAQIPATEIPSSIANFPYVKVMETPTSSRRGTETRQARLE